MRVRVRLGQCQEIKVALRQFPGHGCVASVRTDRRRIGVYALDPVTSVAMIDRIPRMLGPLRLRCLIIVKGSSPFLTATDRFVEVSFGGFPTDDPKLRHSLTRLSNA